MRRRTLLVLSIVLVIIIIVRVKSAKVSRLVNCGGVSNWDKFPKISVLDSCPVDENSDEEICNRWVEKLRNSSSSFFVTESQPLASLELDCSALYPVQWGFRKNQEWAVSTGRERVLSKNGTYHEIFKAYLKYTAIRNVTQLRDDYPTCHKSDDLCTQTTLSVGKDERGKGILVTRKGTENDLQPEAEFGKNPNCSVSMGYDKATQTFYCVSLLPNSNVTMFPKHCSDPVTCRSIYRPSEMPCPETPVIPYSECNGGASKCAKLTYAANYLPSVAICLIRGMEGGSAAMPFFYSLPNRTKDFKPIRYLSWTEVDPTEMIQITDFNNTPIYAGETFSIECNASYFYFGSGMYFEIRKLNQVHSNISIIENNNIADSEDFLKFNSREKLIEQITANKGVEARIPYVRSLIVGNYFVKEPGQFEVTCKAPVWNSTEWIQESSNLTILESIKPIFSSGNMTETLYYKPQFTLKCIATGVPKPKVSWQLDDHPLPPPTSGIRIYIGEQNETIVWMNLQFPNSARGIYGNFTCKASNAAGISEKTYVIIPNDKSSSTPIIIIAILGVLGLFLIPAVVFLVWKVQQQKKQLRYLTQEEIDDFLNGRPDYIPFQSDMSTYAYYLPYDKSFEIPKEHLEIDLSKLLGSGAYGLVVFGHYKNPSEESIEVAIKTSKPFEDGIDMFKALLSELKIMTYIGKHDNIVNLIGACTQFIQKREVYIALEFCENGSLISYLRTNRHTFLNPGFTPETDNENGKPPVSRQPSFLDHPQIQYVKMEDLTHIAIQNQHEYENIHKISTLNLLGWAHEIAEGMNYLASKKVIHGDLAARNVLLTRDLTAKIGDFGLSKRLLHYNSYTRTATTPLPIKWLALECLQDFQFSAESDIWSYGVTLWEIFSLGEIPYSGFNGTGEEFLKALSRGMRLGQPAYCTLELFEVMMSCWRHDRKQRPNFDVLSHYFKKHLSSPVDFAHPIAALRLSAAMRSLKKEKQK